MKKDYLERASYPTDLTDEQWTVIEPLFVGMREYKHSKRELTNAVLYLVDSGCKWRQLPHDLAVLIHKANLHDTKISACG